MVYLLGKVFFRTWDYSYIGGERGTRIFVGNRIREGISVGGRRKHRFEQIMMYGGKKARLSFQDIFLASCNAGIILILPGMSIKRSVHVSFIFVIIIKTHETSERITKKSLFSMKLLIYLKCTILNYYFYLIK